jgi:hypothetical protein
MISMSVPPPTELPSLKTTRTNPCLVKLVHPQVSQGPQLLVVSNCSRNLQPVPLTTQSISNSSTITTCRASCGTKIETSMTMLKMKEVVTILGEVEEAELRKTITSMTMPAMSDHKLEVIREGQ